MYLALVRPHTDYASQVWDPHPQKDIDQLECVQKLVASKWNKKQTYVCKKVGLRIC